MQLLHELKIFFQKGKKKSPAKAELKLQIFTNKALARKWVFSQAAQRETPLRSLSYFVLTRLGFSFAFEFFSLFFFRFLQFSFVRRVLVLARRSRATCIYTSTRLTVKYYFNMVSFSF